MRRVALRWIYLNDCKGYLGYSVQTVGNLLLVWSPASCIVEETIDEVMDEMIKEATDDPWLYLNWYEMVPKNMEVK